MLVGVLHLEVHLPGVGSLKEKRHAFKGLKQRLRGKYNLAVSEDPSLADLWQRAALTFVSVAGSRDPLERLFDTVEREAESHIPGHLVSCDRDFLELDTWDGSWTETEEG